MMFFALAVCFCVIAVIGMAVYLHKELEKQSAMIYVMDKTGSISTADNNELDVSGRLFEYEDHVKTFYKKWYAFDEDSFEPNTTSALYLIGDVGKKMYQKYMEDNILRTLKQMNMRVYVEVKEVYIDMNSMPRTGHITGVQTIKRLKGTVSRNMNCTFELWDVSRSRNNPHGVKIEKWDVVNNVVIEDNE
jgi:hypothetical protein